MHKHLLGVLLTLTVTACQSLPISNSGFINCLKPEHCRFQAWNHAANPELAHEFRALQLPPNAYDPMVTRENEGTLAAVFVTKLSDWTRQHVNGVELLLTESASFKNFHALSFDIKVRSHSSFLLDSRALKKRYEGWINTSVLAELEAGTGELVLTLFEKHAGAPSHALLQSQIRLRNSDEWQTIKLPLSSFSAFSETNYQLTAIDMKDLEDRPLAGLRIVSETTSGKQLRNVLGENWAPTIPETFKEYAVEIRELRLLKSLATLD